MPDNVHEIQAQTKKPFTFHNTSSIILNLKVLEWEKELTHASPTISVC